MVECAVREVLEETGIRVRCQLKGAAPVSPRLTRSFVLKGYVLYMSYHLGGDKCCEETFAGSSPGQSYSIEGLWGVYITQASSQAMGGGGGKKLQVVGICVNYIQGTGVVNLPSKGVPFVVALCMRTAGRAVRLERCPGPPDGLCRRGLHRARRRAGKQDQVPLLHRRGALVVGAAKPRNIQDVLGHEPCN